MAFQRFEWWPCGYPKGSQRISFSRVSEGTLGTFWARFWGVLGTKLGGVSAFRVVAMSRAESDRTRQDGYPKGRQKFFFSRVSEGTLGTFWARFWSVLGTKLGGVSAFPMVAMWLSQRQAKVLFFSRVSEGTLGTFWARFSSVLGTKLGGVSAFRVVAMSSSSSNRSNRRVLCLIVQTVV